MQRKIIVASILGAAAVVTTIALGGLAVRKWKVTSTLKEEKVKQAKLMKRPVDKTDKQSSGKCWNREQVAYSLLFPLLRSSMCDGTKNIYFLRDDNNLTADFKDSLATRRITNEEMQTRIETFWAMNVVSSNRETGTFEFTGVFGYTIVYVGRIISINSQSLRIRFSFPNPTKKFVEKFTTLEIYFDKSNLSNSAYRLFERLQKFEDKLKTATATASSHFALSDLLDPKKVDNLQFDEMLGTYLTNSVIQAQTDFDHHTPLPIVLRRLTFEYSN